MSSFDAFIFAMAASVVGVICLLFVSPIGSILPFLGAFGFGVYAVRMAGRDGDT